MNKAEKCMRLLEEADARFDKIFLFEREELVSGLYRAKTTNSRNFLVLSTKKIVSDAENITFQQITEEEKEWLIELYFTYEFSDKFLFVSTKNISYGGLSHFVDTGILSMEEAIEALIN